MDLQVNWNISDLKKWDDVFSRCRRSTLLQSYDYARAVAPIYRQKPRWGFISVDGQTAGLVQIMEVRLGMGLIHGLIIDRGPLWLSGYGDDDHQAAFWSYLGRKYPPRLGRKRRILPEWELSAASQILTQCGFKQASYPSYQTIWMELSHGDEDLRAALRKPWRNSLSKGERQGVTIKWDTGQMFQESLLAGYIADKEMKGYNGPSPKIIKALMKSFSDSGNLLVGAAFAEGKMVAGGLFLCHGKAATYQVGWTTQDGRNLAANNVLLWSSLGRLRDKGITDLDLGGVNDEAAETVKKFKKGMGGTLSCLCGLYN